MIYPILTDGVFLIKHAEGLRLTPYKDSGGILTVGYGHTKNVLQRDITEVEAELYLVEDLADTMNDISKYVKVPINAFQKAALASFIFNLGGSKFRTSTLCRLLNEGSYAGASQQFNRWIYGKNKQGKVVVLPGLAKRRMAEKRLFLGWGWGEIVKNWENINED